jgi:HPt (histidine-containing phosphotransfer) domain-containing protein
MDQALRAMGGNQDLVDELFAQFCNELPGQVSEIGQYLIAREWKKVSELAHYLCGSASTCGAPALYDAAKRLEKAALASRISYAGLTPLYEQLQQQTDRLLEKG